MREVMTAETWGVPRVWFEVLSLLILLGESGYREKPEHRMAARQVQALGDVNFSTPASMGSLETQQGKYQNFPVPRKESRSFYRNKSSSPAIPPQGMRDFQKVMRVTGPLLCSPNV
jgi:hypothetical protein